MDNNTIMNVFRNIFKVVFLTQIALWLVASFTYLFSYKVFLYFDFLAVNIMLFIQTPIFLVFIFVVLYNWLLKKKPFIFFKTEYIYVSAFIGTLLLLGLFFYICSTCNGK